MSLLFRSLSDAACLFVIVMEAISTEFRVALLWELLYADDLVVITEAEDDLITRSTQRAQTSADPEDPDFGLWTPRSEA